MKGKITPTLFIFFLSFSLFSFSSFTEEETTLITIKNNLPIDRSNETVEINISSLELKETHKNVHFGLLNINSNTKIVSQWIDTNDDKIYDILLFQPEVKANSTSTYEITLSNKKIVSKVFSRFVPERTDDYAWENDRVAFRVFGPAAQKLVENQQKGGTLSSGIDCWLKRVNYPIINKWYKKYTDKKGSYNKDTGEGLDNYHVGSTRGCGGTGVFENEKLYTSKNFTSYKTLLNGPIRTSFNLEYAPWKTINKTITEKKHVSLDLGAHLSTYKINITGSETITIGLTLHENDGKATINKEKGWFNYWQPHGKSELGTAIVIDPKYYSGYKKIVSKKKRGSQLLIHLKVIDGVVEYKAGFAWAKSGQFSNQTDWENYLNSISLKSKNPLIATISSKK